MHTKTKIRFIAYCIPTQPAHLINIGPSNAYCAGTYQGNQDFLTDIQDRIAILKFAVDTAKGQLKNPNDPDVLNLFVVPEFFFRGVNGAYLYSNKTIEIPGFPILPTSNPSEIILNLLSNTFLQPEYSNWTFVFGTSVSIEGSSLTRLNNLRLVESANFTVKNLAENWLTSPRNFQSVYFQSLQDAVDGFRGVIASRVQDQALVVSNAPILFCGNNNASHTAVVQKEFDAGDDFVLFDPTGKENIILEQMTNYPAIDTSEGDLKSRAEDWYSVFRLSNGPSGSGLDCGVEICLDHASDRLRCKIGSKEWEHKDIRLQIQIIPSCGSQIQLTGVAATANGFVFNCDGAYAIGEVYNKPQNKMHNQQGVKGVYVNYFKTYTDHTLGQQVSYYGHSQLARVKKPASNEGGYPNATFHKMGTQDIAVLPLLAPDSLKPASYFAGGEGAIHIYGWENPFSLVSDAEDNSN